MAQQDASELLNALEPAIRAAAKNVVRHAYGPEGLPWGTRFLDAESLAVQAGDLLTRAVLQAALQEQAGQPRPDHLSSCPSCSGPLDGRPAEARAVQSRRGAVTWEEPTAYCPHCRRAFFPSVSEPGP